MTKTNKLMLEGIHAAHIFHVETESASVLPGELLTASDDVLSDVTRVRVRDQDPALFDESTGEFFTRSPPPPRQHLQAVKDALAELKFKVKSANEFDHRHDTPAPHSPQKKVLPSPATRCSPPPAAKQNILDF
jgi:hypothetical protein